MLVVVIPTIREAQCLEFLEAWKHFFRVIFVDKVIVIEDSPTKTFKLPEYPIVLEHYSHKEIDELLKENAWIIPRKTDCIRSFGFYLAYKHGYNVYTLDDDVRPPTPSPELKHKLNQFIGRFERSLQFKGNNSSYVNYGANLSKAWVEGEYYVRGYPFKDRNSKAKTREIIYGGWNVVPDFDAVTQLKELGEKKFFCHAQNTTVPKYQALTGCIMNTFISCDAIPLMYQLLMGQEYGYDRWGDIWSGLFAKRIADIHNIHIGYGEFHVDHLRASSPKANAMKEASGYAINEKLWDKMLLFNNKSTTQAKTYQNLGQFIIDTDLFEDKEYSTKLGNAMITWIKVLQCEE